MDEEPAATGAAPEHRLRADAARNRQRVLDAAAEVFAERGLQATLDDVARRAGVGVGTVYRRFADKESLVDALFADRVADIVRLADEALTGQDPWGDLVGFVEQALQRQVQDLGLKAVLLQSQFGHHRVAQARDRIAPVVAKLIERAQAAGALRPDIVANDVPMLMKMVGAVAEYCAPGDAELWRRYLTILLDGLVCRRSAGTPLPDPPTQQVVDQAMAGGG
jgi:AcrR family transcriptional regulator